MGKIKLSNTKVNAIEPGIIDPVHEIPGLGEEELLDLSVIDGWDELKLEQQKYLVEFSKMKLKEKRAAIKAGINLNRLAEWKRTDGLFSTIFNDIIDIHVEGVEEVDYLASYAPSNNTSRGRFLNNRSKRYKDTEQPLSPSRIGTQNNQTNILAVLNSDDVTEKGLAGVQKMFNKMKNSSKELSE